MKYWKFILVLITASVFLSGCYTQLAMKPSEYEKKYEEEYADEGYYGDDTDSSEYYADEEYDEEEDVEINNYYYGGYPTYRRYYWGYYPTISIGFHWGWNYGYSYYDPFCWDPFWCGPF